MRLLGTLLLPTAVIPEPDPRPSSEHQQGHWEALWGFSCFWKLVSYSDFRTGSHSYHNDTNSFNKDRLWCRCRSYKDSRIDSPASPCMDTQWLKYNHMRPRGLQEALICGLSRFILVVLKSEEPRSPMLTRHLNAPEGSFTAQDLHPITLAIDTTE